MERMRISSRNLERVKNLQQGLDAYGVPIASIEHLQQAFEDLAQSLIVDLGGRAEDYLDAYVRPYVKEIIKRFGEG